MNTSSIESLSCEYLTNPLGIDIPDPRLSWKLRSERRGARQTAYRVRVARSVEALAAGQADLWDSGRIESDRSVHVVYAGAPPASGERAWWTVRVWDETGDAVDAATPAWWETGLLQPSDWRAEWIGAELLGGPRTSVPSPYLRRPFSVDRPIASARLYATALGLYDIVLNGERVGDQELTPGWTDYGHRLRYQTYDVTPLLQAGENVIGAILGDGWGVGTIAWQTRQRYSDRPKLLAQLHVRYEDGSEEIVATDGAWKRAFGPLLENDMLAGESYDARLEMPGWDRPGFDDSRWSAVETFTAPQTALVAQNTPPIRKQETLQYVEVKERAAWPNPYYIFDFGQNLVGRVRLTLRGADGKPLPAGVTVTLRHGEVLTAKGDLYTENLRSAKQTDHYTTRGLAEEVWEPRFTFHGFRYVEARGLPVKPDAETLVAHVMHSDLPATGEFSCSEPLVNQLQHNIEWGWKGNSVDVPTDCPQRDERLGWTGDAQVFVRTAAFNRQVAPFFAKWQQDLADSQSERGAFPSVAPNPEVTGPDGGPAWADAGIICPWTMYLCYGDSRILERHYDSMARFLRYLEETSKDCIRVYEGYADFAGYGDWLALDGSGKTEGGTPKDLIGTAFFAHDADLMGRIASVLGRDGDAERYRALFERVRLAFLDRYVTRAGRVAAETQTAYILALHFNLLPEELRAPAAQALVRDIERRGWHLSTGFVGSPYINHVLTATGHLDAAYKLLHQKAWPSWLYAVTQGATTIWERWDGWTHDRGFQDAGMNSFNHYAYGAIGAWLYQSVAGIDVDPEIPGYKHVVLRPRPGGGLTHARAALDSVYGRIESDWTQEGSEFRWSVTVPPNATATVYVPAPEGAAVTEGGQAAEDAPGVTLLRRDRDAAVYALGSGRYEFAVG